MQGEAAIATVADEATARQQLKDKKIGAWLAVPPDLSSAGTLTFQESRDATLADICNQAVIYIRAGEAARPRRCRSWPRRATTRRRRSSSPRLILLFIGIFPYGQWSPDRVVEEKQSRVVEVVLSTVRPRDLLVGKVLGIATLAIGQLAALVAVGLGASQLSGQFTLPPTTSGAVLELVLWFVLGFLFFATAMGTLGSLASRPDEANNAAMPVTMSATFSYVATLIFVIQNPDGIIAQVMTFIPISAPMVVPMRVALGAIQPWEVIGSVVVMVIAIWLLFEAGARIYSGAVLASGSRMKIRDAWRASGSGPARAPLRPVSPAAGPRSSESTRPRGRSRGPLTA
ncbi:MAG: ABC transporter permease [Chloroflexota bacterium]